MNLTLLAVGRVRDTAIAELCGDYARRIVRYGHTLDVIEVKEERVGTDANFIVSRETGRLRERLPKGAFVVALDPAGEMCDSTELASRLQELALRGRSRLVFALGGACGLEREFVRGADWALSLSRMTFPHELARLMLLEQLYRADTIIRGEPYHK